VGRVGRLKETLEIIKALWAGETVDYAGEHFTLKGARQAPSLLGTIPIVIGGGGRRTMELVAAHADWWNLHVGILDAFERMRPLAGSARVSLQVQVAYVHSEESREDTVEAARRRFGPQAVAGSAAELADHFAALARQGIERAYVWLCDFPRLTAAPARRLRCPEWGMTLLCQSSSASPCYREHIRKKLSGWRDSNPRPPAPKSAPAKRQTKPGIAWRGVHLGQRWPDSA